MYELQFQATDDADWAVALALIDDDTNRALDTTNLSFDLDVKHRGHVRLSLSSSDGSITIPEPGTIQWIVPAATMRGLSIETTYDVGCRMNSPGGVSQLFIGTLAFIDGGLD